MPAAIGYHNVALGATAQTIKSGPGRVYSVLVVTGAAAAYIQFLDDSADTLGTDAPSLVVHAPANTSVMIPLHAEGVIIGAMDSATAAIRIAATTTPTGNTAPATLPSLVEVVYS